MRQYRRWDSVFTQDYLQKQYVELGRSVLSIAKEHSCQRRIVEKWMARHDIQKRRWAYPVNETYFDEWTENSAYILGYTMADGHIRAPKRSLHYHIQSKDIEILEFIRDELAPESPIRDCKNGSIELGISSIYLCDKLAEYNIVPQKSCKEHLPFVPWQYRGHYLRGLMDGDGTLGYYVCKKRTNARISFNLYSGGPEFLEEVRSELGKGYGNVYTYPCGKYLSHRWCVFRKDDAMELMGEMYDQGGFSLSRKRKVYEKVVCYRHDMS